MNRRHILLGATTAALTRPAIARALSIDADVRTGTLADVAHVVVFMQENRAFDHYFGAFRGVRGFGDRFPIPVPDAPGRVRKTCWTQANDQSRGGPPLVSPFPLNTVQDFRFMRVEGTPHNWADAQDAWDEGRMSRWPAAKTEHAMGYYREADIPFQYALAEAFTLCDAYHCSIQSGTNSNRLFLWTGTNDPAGEFGGPAISNSHDSLVSQGGDPASYRWTTYPERLLAAGVSWRIYQDMADNFSDNPTAGFESFRDSYDARPGADPRLAALALSTRTLDGLRQDVLDGALPQVSWIVAPAKDSEHPGPSSPAQGADYTARVIEALTADPKVWARTVLLLIYDENDGFFDHMPPPAPPSLEGSALNRSALDRSNSGRSALDRSSLDGPSASPAAGGSTVDTTGEHHLAHAPSEARAERPDLRGRAYGLGPRVPMCVISPWSRGGWVNSQVFDHTSLIRFLERRFGVREPNISPWRREVCGDLTSAFDFRTPNRPFPPLPATKAAAVKAAALPGRATPTTPASPLVPVQADGVRRSRALPYVLGVDEDREGGAVRLTFRNDGQAGAVFHVYDRRRLNGAPRRYTVGAGRSLQGVWKAGAYDLWVLGPDGFHRHFVGDAGRNELAVAVAYDPAEAALSVTLANPGEAARSVSVTANAYGLPAWRAQVAPGASAQHRWPLSASQGWYDLSVRCDEAANTPNPAYLRRLAGRLETGRDSISDPAMGGPAVMEQG